MLTHQSTVRVNQIPEIIDDPKRGVVSLVGDSGGLALITGPQSLSGIMGTMAIETEHGVLYLDPEAEVTISEMYPSLPDHFRAERGSWRVSWEIDADDSTPREAVEKTWRDYFGRTAAGPDDACVFTVSDPRGGVTMTIDLSEELEADVAGDPQ